MSVKPKILKVAKYMPPLKHTTKECNYDMRKSDVVKWLMLHPYTWEYIWNAVKASGAIVYDKETGLWQGTHYDDN